MALPLDAHALQRVSDMFAPAVSKIWLEIGFGGGEHLIWQAARNRDAGLIGCEPFEDGVVKVLGAIDTEGLANVKVHADDGRPLLRLLPEASVDRSLHPFSRPMAQETASQAPARFDTKRLPSLPASCGLAVNFASRRT